MKKRKSPIVLLLILIGLGVGGYYGYRFIERTLQKRAFKHALEKGCEEVIQKYEDEQDGIAKDIERLMDRMEELDDDDAVSELEEIRDALKERK